MNFPAHGRTPPAKPSPPERSPPMLPIPTQKFHLNALTHIKPVAIRAAGFFVYSFRLFILILRRVL